MTGFTLNTFGGKAPKVYARLLPNDMAQVATNCRLDSGRLNPWKGNAATSITPVASYTVTAQTKTLFKYSDTIWLGSDHQLDVVRSPIAEDRWERIYLTGRTNAYPEMTLSSIVGSGTYYRLGLPSPPSLPSAPALSTTSVSATETPKSRSYIYTYLTQYGEEGPPSTPLVANIVDVHSDQTATVTFGSNVSGYNITHKRLYRTDSTGTYRRVTEVAFTEANFADDKNESQLGEEIPSSSWEAPPDDVSADHPDGAMQGLVAMPNGILAGFSGQTVCFSEAFLPHAWPKAYQLTVKSDVVAIAPLTSGLLVLTTEKPAIIQGLDPASMSMMEIDSTLSCVSKRSVVDMGEYVMYASPDGLVMGGEQGLQLATDQVLTRDQWQEFVPSSLVGFMWEGHYVGFYSTASENKGFIFDPRGGKNSFVSLDFHATAGFNDLANDELYLVVGGSVVKFAAGTALRATWRTKKFYTPRPICPAVAKVNCDSYPVTAVTYAVTVVASGGNKYAITGLGTAPVLTLQRGVTYTFDVSNSSNSGHPFRFRTSSDSSYTSGVSINGVAGSAGATVVFAVPLNAPSGLKYYCTVHGNGMGNSITLEDDQGMTLKLYADGVLRHTQIVANNNIFMLPSGYKAQDFEVELSTRMTINEFCVYESASEIGGG